MYTLLPLLIPVGISVAVIRISLSAHHSRARIRLLEQDESSSEKLIHILAQLEKNVEDVVVDLIDDSGPSPVASSSTDVSTTDGQALTKKAKKTKLPPEQPILTPLQRNIAASLNKLPIKKELAYIWSVRNSHATIVCRDVKRFEAHREGEGIVRHWATSFVL